MSIFSELQLKAQEKKNIERIIFFVIAALFLALLGELGAYRYLLSGLHPFSSEINDGNKAQVPKKSITALFTVSGKIIEVKKDAVVVNNSLSGQKELKTVLLTRDTRITQLKFVPVVSGNEKRYVSQEAPLEAGALTVGLMVEALGSKDVRNLEQFAATQIRVLP